MKGSQKKARQGVLLSVIDFEVLTSFNRFAVWVLGAGYFWTVTIDILVITRRTGIVTLKLLMAMMHYWDVLPLLLLMITMTCS